MFSTFALIHLRDSSSISAAEVAHTALLDNESVVILFGELRKRSETSVSDVRRERGQAAVSRSGPRSQDTLLLSVSIYHKARVKERAYFLDLSTSHSAELFCRIIANKGNLCTAEPGVPKRKTNTQMKDVGGGSYRRKCIYINGCRCYFWLMCRANSRYVPFWLALSHEGDGGNPAEESLQLGRRHGACCLLTRRDGEDRPGSVPHGPGDPP